MRTRNLIRAGAAAAVVAAGYGLMTRYRQGRADRAAWPHDPLLEPYMPRYDVRERHEAEVLAPAETTWASVRTLDLDASRLIQGIFQARQLLMGGRLVPAEAPKRPFLDEVVALGWRVLSEAPGRSMVLGAVTQPWVADVVFRGVPEEEFAGFDEPGHVKIAWTVEVVPLDGDRSVFRTETRAVATDQQSRTRFGRYWTLVRPGILLIRREMLRLVRREAETRARFSGDQRTTGPRLEPGPPAPTAR